MLIGSHTLPASALEFPGLQSPYSWSYDTLRAEIWGDQDQNMPCWVTRKDQLDLSLVWTHAQRDKLRTMTRVKTYEVVQGPTPESWIGIEHIGYRIQEGPSSGFLPVRVVYRWSDATQSCLLPRNIGWLHWYTANEARAPMVWVVPSKVALVLDLDLTRPDHPQSNHIYGQIRDAVPRFLDGRCLSEDLRSEDGMRQHIHTTSILLDVVGHIGIDNLPGGGAITWFDHYLVPHPPIRDNLLRYAAAPIDFSMLQRLVGPGMMDTTPMEGLTLPGFALSIPGRTLQICLSLCSTACHIPFPTRLDQTVWTPSSYFVQNRFAAYFDCDAQKDWQRLMTTLRHLWATTTHNPTAPGPIYVGYQMTDNDEILIEFGDQGPETVTHRFYADLNTVTDAWLGISFLATPADLFRHPKINP